MQVPTMSLCEDIYGEWSHTHTHGHTHTEYMFDGLFVKLFKNACTIKSWFICIIYASFCPHRVWYITENTTSSWTATLKLIPPPPKKKRVICSWAAYPLLFASLLLFSTHLIFCVDGLQLWSLNLCRDSTVRQPPGCMCYSMHWCNYTYVSPQPSLALSHTNTYSHAGI